MSSKPLPSLNYGTHCFVIGPDGAKTTIEWRVCLIGGPLIMVTRDESLARMLAAAPAVIGAAQMLLKDWDAPDINDTTPIAEHFTRLRNAVAQALPPNPTPSTSATL